MSKNTFFKFSSLFFQLGVSVFLGAYFGEKLDTYYKFSKPYVSVLLVVLAIALNVYSLLKQLKKMQ